MRVENPLKYGEVLLSLVLPHEHYTEERLQKMFGGSEININFPTNIPVHLTYQTAFVDEAGKLATADDVYGRDARLLAVLKGSERKVADIADRAPAELLGSRCACRPARSAAAAAAIAARASSTSFSVDRARRNRQSIGRRAA